jgi:4-hydroxy-tetrahydrodipicolinate reductase
VSPATTALRVAVAGASGRMGRMLIEAVQADAQCVLAAALETPGHPLLGSDAAAFSGQPSGVVIESGLDVALAKAEVLIDFTRPEGTLAHLAACARLGVGAVIGTTGFSAEQKAQIGAHAQKTAVVFAPNMNVGVQALLGLLAQAARTLGPGYDVEIVEAHHRHKVDAPSGTALKMGEVIATARGQAFDEVAVFSREGHTGERLPGSIGFAALRGGDVIGEHTALFIGVGERIEITHRSTSRAGYAQGSLRAAKFLRGQRSGLFDMADVLAAG